jgi:hypothetical protein
MTSDFVFRVKERSSLVRDCLHYGSNSSFDQPLVDQSRI